MSLACAALIAFLFASIDRHLSEFPDGLKICAEETTWYFTRGCASYKLLLGGVAFVLILLICASVNRRMDFDSMQP